MMTKRPALSGLAIASGGCTAAARRIAPCRSAMHATVKRGGAARAEAEAAAAVLRARMVWVEPCWRMVLHERQTV